MRRGGGKVRLMRMEVEVGEMTRVDTNVFNNVSIVDDGVEAAAVSSAVSTILTARRA